MTKEQNLDNLIFDFLEYCEIEKNLSSSTTAKYHYRLKRFLDWTKGVLKKEKVKASDITESLIRRFRVYLNHYQNPISKRPLKKSTQNHFLVTIRSFLRFLTKLDYKTTSAEKVELGKSESRSVKFLNLEQLKRLFSQPDVRKEKGLRDRAILELLFSTGLRVSELVGLNREDINFDALEFSVLGKGGSRRVVFLSGSAKNWLVKYLSQRKDSWKPLFIRTPKEKRSRGSKNNENLKSSIQSQLEDPAGEKFRLSIRSVQRMIKKCVHQAGLSIEATPHTLRHSFATDLLMQGADIRSVQELLGHKNVATTQIYTHVTNQRLQEIHKKFHSEVEDE